MNLQKHQCVSICARKDVLANEQEILRKVNIHDQPQRILLMDFRDSYQSNLLKFLQNALGIKAFARIGNLTEFIVNPIQVTMCNFFCLILKLTNNLRTRICHNFSCRDPNTFLQESLTWPGIIHLLISNLEANLRHFRCVLEAVSTASIQCLTMSGSINISALTS